MRFISYLFRLILLVAVQMTAIGAEMVFKSSLIQIGGLMAAGMVAASSFGAETTVKLESFEKSQAEYATELGREFPGANAVLAWSEEGHEKKGSLSLLYDFSAGGQYVGWNYSGFMPASISQITIDVLTKSTETLILRLIDSSGQIHQFNPSISGSAEWQALTVDIPPPTEAGPHWGGKNDGVIHFPLTRILIGIEKKKRDDLKGSVLFDNLCVVSTVTSEQLKQQKLDFYWKTQELVFLTKVPGSLFYPDDSAVGELSASPHPEGAELAVAVDITDADNKKIVSSSALLSKYNRYTAKLDLPAKLGFYRLDFKITEGVHALTSNSRYAVIPKNLKLNGKDIESPFGVNTHFNQGWPAEFGRIAKRAGIAWIRDGEASLDDKAVAVARSNRLCYLPCFTAYTTTAAKKLDAQGKWDFAEIADWHRKYAEKYGKEIDAYDLMNEPAGHWSAVLGGGWWGGPWLDAFVIYGRQITQALRQGDPGCTVLWEDIDQLLWYKRLQELGAGDVIDAISPHPYNLHRSAPLPEDQPILRQYAGFREFTRLHKLTWPVWLGEVGFSSFQIGNSSPNYYSPCSEAEQAQLLVRMMVLNLSGGAQRIFWYDLRNDGWEPQNPEYNFGLTLTDGLPKPAVVAYANLIHRLNGCRWLGPYTIGGNAFAVAVACQQGATPTLIAWLRQGATAEAIPVVSGAKQLTVTDIYGRSQPLPVVNHRAELPLSAAPIYIDGLKMDDLQPYLRETP